MSSNVDLQRLQLEIAELRAENEKLHLQLEVFSSNKRLTLGSRGERLLAQLLRAEKTSHVASYDLKTATGARVEVKTSRLLSMTGVQTKRWTWGKILGTRGRKDYDYLVLLGETDRRYCEHYPDGDGPYVSFLVPFGDVLGVAGGASLGKQIQVTTNPASKTLGRVGRVMFGNYMVSLAQLESTLGDIHVPESLGRE